MLGTTNMDPQGNSSLAGANVCANPDLQKPTLWVNVHPNSTVLLYVFKPALHFQYSRFHPFQIEKCVQSCVKTLKICVHSCFCLKLPIGPWINCFISASGLHLKGMLAYSHQEVHSSLGESMCLCALYSKSSIWEVACICHCITDK